MARIPTTGIDYLAGHQHALTHRDLNDTERAHLVSLVDYTLLSTDISDADVDSWAARAGSPVPGQPWGPVAGLCTWPIFIDQIADTTHEHFPTVAVVSVAGDFPDGSCSDTMVAQQVSSAARHGADEIDIVIDHHKYLSSKDPAVVFDRVRVASDAAHSHGALCKVILETGHLANSDLVFAGAAAACEAGADFVKTSTGFTYPGADHETFAACAHAVREHFERTSKRVGVKASGGIKTFEQADTFVRLAVSICGEEWDDPTLMRIGASSLLDAQSSY